MEVPNIIVFDFDQTIVDMFRDKKRWKPILLERMTKYYSKYVDIDPDIHGGYTLYYESIGKVIDKYGESKAREINDIAEDMLCDYEVEVLDTVEYFPNAVKILRKIHDMGITLCIASNNGVGPIEDSLKKNGIIDIFSAVEGRRKPFIKDHVKPSTIFFDRAMSTINKKDSDIVFMVGDRCSDIKLGINVNAVAIGTLTGHDSEEQLIEAGAKYIIKDLGDLYERIKNAKA